MILHTIEINTRGEDDLILTEKECEIFFGKAQAGGSPSGK